VCNSEIVTIAVITSMSLKEIFADQNASCWLKDALRTSYERDPIDALLDAQRLLKLLGERYAQIVNRGANSDR
jgi:hypothetical protein